MIDTSSAPTMKWDSYSSTATHYHNPTVSCEDWIATQWQADPNYIPVRQLQRAIWIGHSNITWLKMVLDDSKH